MKRKATHDEEQQSFMDNELVDEGPASHTHKQWRMQKISDGGAKFRHDRITSQINFRGSAEGTTILGGPVACPGENFAKLHLKIRIFVHSGSKF